MRKINKYVGMVGWCAVMAVSGLSVSCADDWNDHYDGVPRPERTLWQEITSRPDLADFAKLLKSRGCDKYLDSDQRYTVWAPVGKVDTMLVTGGHMSAEEVLTQVVNNHIARGVIPASPVVSRDILVLNGKPMPFVAEEGVPYFNGAEVKVSNIECSNGNLHILGCQADYNNNIWSYLRQESGFSNISQYLYSFNKMVFSPELSTPGGVVNGEQVYLDSVFVQNNELWGQIGYLNNENRRYTMLVPENQNYDNLVNTFKSFYNYADEEHAGEAGMYARRRILDVLVFDMNQQKGWPEYWTSTAGIKVYNPEAEDGLFAGTEEIGCSNGTILKGGNIEIDPYQVVATDMVVEAERYADFLVDGNYYDEDRDRPVFVAAAGTGVSSSYYMKFTSINRLRGATVTYALPNVLSCRYDIGVVFVPTNLTRNGWMSNIDQKKGRVDFELSDGYTREKVTVKNVEIPGNKVDTLWVVKGHEFTYCDYFPNRESLKKAPITLKITSTPKMSESAYTRDLYIDCIVIKPTVNKDLSDEE